MKSHYVALDEVNLRKVPCKKLKNNALFLILDKMVSRPNPLWPILLLNMRVPFGYRELNIVIAEERKIVSH